MRNVLIRTGRSELIIGMSLSPGSLSGRVTGNINSSLLTPHSFHDPSFEVFDLIQFEAFVGTFRGDLFHIMGDHPADQRFE